MSISKKEFELIVQLLESTAMKAYALGAANKRAGKQNSFSFKMSKASRMRLMTALQAKNR